MIGLGSCDKVAQTNVTNVDYSLVLEAKDRFESDSTMNVVVIEKGDMNYVFERGNNYPILKSYTDYNTVILTVLLFGIFIGFVFGFGVSESVF